MMLISCNSITPTDLPDYIQKNNQLGKIIFSTESQVFEDTHKDYLDGRPKDMYVTFFDDSVSLSFYSGRKLNTKIIKYKDIKEIAYSKGQVTDYIRPRFFIINFDRDVDVNQLYFYDGKSYYVLRLTVDEIDKVKNITDLKNIKVIEMKVVKRIRTTYDIQMEQAAKDAYIYIPIPIGK